MKKTGLSILCILLIVFTAIPVYSSQIPLSEEGELVLEEYSEINLNAEDVLVPEEMIDTYMELMPEDLSVLTGETVTMVSDDLVREYSPVYFGIQLNTVEEAREYIRYTLEESNQKDALMEALRKKAKIISYPEAVYEMAADYTENEIAYYALQENISTDELAILSGYGSAEEYVRMEAENYVATSMILNRIMDDEAIIFQEEDRDAALEEYMQALGYDAYVSVEEFKETAGETWLWLFTEFQYKSDLVYQALKDRIQIVEP